MSAQLARRWTPAEYLAFERQHAEKHEYHAGQISRQAGGSRAHALIGVNIASSLHQQLRARACAVYSSDVRVAIPRAQRYVYPDLSVVCGAARFEDQYEDSLVNPTLIVEILSPSTERYDRGKKFLAYQTIESFQEYLLVAQDAALIERFTRRSDRLWTFDVFTERAALVELASVGCVLALAEVYEKVALPDLGG